MSFLPYVQFTYEYISTCIDGAVVFLNIYWAIFRNEFHILFLSVAVVENIFLQKVQINNFVYMHPLENNICAVPDKRISVCFVCHLR